MCWFLALIIILPVPIHTKYIWYPAYGAATCREKWPDFEQEKAYSIMVPILLLVVPLIIMSLAYGLISITLWTGIKLDEKSEMGKDE